METKKLNKSILGKDGMVKTTSIQRHIPQYKMSLIKLESNHFLFCQGNHPIIVNESEDIICAEDITIDDYIYVNNEICFNKNEYIPIENKEEVVQNLLDNECDDYNFLLKNDEYSLRFNDNFINFSEYWIKNFLDLLIEKCPMGFRTKSIVLSAQLKAMCDRVGYFFSLFNYCEFDNVFTVLLTKNDKKEVIKGYKKVIQKIVVKDYPGFVYDVKTETGEYINNGVQTHNSFHCLSKDQLIYVKINDEYKVTTFKSVWDTYGDLEVFITEDDQEEKYPVDLFVWDKDTFTKVNRIIRHKKDESAKMVMIRSNNSDFVVCQDNHPLMLSKNNTVCSCGTPFIRKKHEPYRCPSCGEKPVGRRFPGSISNEIYEMVQPKEFIKSKYMSYNSFPIWQTDFTKPTIMDPYIIGLFLAEGSFLYYYKGTKLAGLIITQQENDIKKKALDLLENKYRVVVNTSATRSTLQIILYEEELAKDMLNQCDHYSYQKCIGDDLIYYDDDTLSKILCGFIDGDASFIDNTEKNHSDFRNFISLESTSLRLIQELHLILTKFDMRHNISLCTVKNLTRHQSYRIVIYPTEKHRDILKHSVKCNGKRLENDYSRNRNDNLITYCKELFFDENEYVYDFTTESGTLTTNGIWSHNTGSSVDLKLVNYTYELMRNLDDSKRTFVDKVIIQDENDLITNASFTTVYIDKNLFNKTDRYKLKSDNEFIYMPFGYFDLTFDSLKIPVNIEFPVKIYLKDADMEETPDYYLVTFTKGNKVLNSIPRSIEPHKVANAIKEVLGGGSPFTTVESLYYKLYSMTKDFSDFDSVHLEVIMSNILRAKKDPQLPARLKEPFEFNMYSVKKLPGIMSWPLGLAFENYTAAITQGMISERAPESQIERIMMGDIMAENDAADEEREKRENRAKRSKLV